MADDEESRTYTPTEWLLLLWGIFVVVSILALAWRFFIRPLLSHLSL